MCQSGVIRLSVDYYFSEIVVWQYITLYVFIFPICLC
jgi:hypothetical protein